MKRPDGPLDRFRTYRIRALRPKLREIDVDTAFHVANGRAGHLRSAATISEEISARSENDKVLPNQKRSRRR
ncbi:siderophore-interacting protein [Rhodoglobus vestalii]|uniref:siderophore-interacting protein n=1 Tax=Rhodoglobus vestalii TaxID=193384 RepID=UPI001150E672|nr:siderophore-interacting protein [Rhodoglobus vestalii]